MPTAPIWYIRLPYNASRCPYDRTQLQYCSQGFQMAPCGSHTGHVAPTWHMCPHWTPTTSHVVPYGSRMADTWFSNFTTGSHLPYSSHAVHAAPLWCMWLLCGIFSSHMAHAAPIWCTQLPYSTHGSHIEHTTPIWPSHGTCSFDMVSCASHMVPSTSNMAHTAPTQHTQLSYGPHMSQSAQR
jgi:hypothetical protein